MQSDLMTKHNKPIGPRERVVTKWMLIAEDIWKVPMFGCQRCGECILSHTALICCQRCPKRLRNGPCGGTRDGGYCEVYPEKRCVWFRIYKRSRLLRRMPFLYEIEKIHDWALEKTAAWLNVFRKRIEWPALWMKRKDCCEPER